MNALPSSQSSEIPLLTFNSLYNILREEKKKKELQQLPEAFFKSLEQFLDSKKEELRKYKEEGNKEKFRREKSIFNNSKKIIQELFNLRCVKIAHIGIKNTLFDEQFLSEESILEEERRFLEHVNNGIKEIKKEVL